MKFKRWQTNDKEISDAPDESTKEKTTNDKPAKLQPLKQSSSPLTAGYSCSIDHSKLLGVKWNKIKERKAEQTQNVRSTENRNPIANQQNATQSKKCIPAAPVAEQKVPLADATASSSSNQTSSRSSVTKTVPVVQNIQEDNVYVSVLFVSSHLRFDKVPTKQNSLKPFNFIYVIAYCLRFLL